MRLYMRKFSFTFRHNFINNFSSQPVQLLPEVQNLLESGSIKHRKHPGIKKVPPIQLPATLIQAAYKLIHENIQKTVTQKADALKKVLVHRRLPVDKEEFKLRVKRAYHLEKVKDEIFPELYFKKELLAAQKQVISEVNRWKPIEYDHFTCLAYLVARLAPNYASISKVFSEIKSSLPSFQPKTFFDFGSGLGTALWAAQSTWENSIEEFFCVDSSDEMNEVAQQLLKDEQSGDLLVDNVYFRQFLPVSDKLKYDLVVSAFSMLDITSGEERIRVIDTLWRKTNDTLVIIESGNLAGFFSVLDARDYILERENQSPDSSLAAHVLLPCPHELPCPRMGTKIPCGFHVPYETLFPRHRTVHKKDWISYVVLRKGTRQAELNTWPRLVKPVLKKSGFVICRACCSDGRIKEFTITKGRHGRHAYRCARSSSLGDMLPFSLEPSTPDSGSSEPSDDQ